LCFWWKSLSRPAHGLFRLFRHPADIPAGLRGEDGYLTITLDKMDGKRKIQQRLQGFILHGSGNYVAPDHDLVHPKLTNLLNDSFQGGEIPMNVIKGGYSHDVGLAWPLYPC
jgi:hypothetical protein